MAKGIPAEIAPYNEPPDRSYEGDEGKRSFPTQRASFTPSGGPTLAEHHSYGRSVGKAAAQTGNIPSVVVGGSSEVAALPAYPETLKIGDDKNVSTPVSG